jgi:serine/threonine-protein kinase RsbW
MTLSSPTAPGLPPTTLAVRSHLDALEQVLAWFEQWRHPAVPPQLWMEAQLGLVEGFTNAVRHAHAHLVAPPDVTVSVQVASGLLCVEVIDHGEPFDLESAFAQLEEEMSEGDHDPLARDAHWGLVMLLRLRKDYGWTIGYHRKEKGGNGLALHHAISADVPADRTC